MTSLAVLFVDDDADIRTIVTLALSLDPAMALTTAGSGAEALELVRSGLSPDVVLLDVMMPEMSGPALMTRLSDQAARLPVIFMTANAREADLASYRALGAAGVIVKPFDPLTLAREIRTLLKAPAHPAR